MSRNINEEILRVYGLTKGETKLLEGILAGFVTVRNGKNSRIIYKDQSYDCEYGSLCAKLPRGALEIIGNGIKFDPKLISGGIPELQYDLYTNGLYNHNTKDCQKEQRKIVGFNVYNGWNEFVGCLTIHIIEKLMNWLYIDCKFDQKNLVRYLKGSNLAMQQENFDRDSIIGELNYQIQMFHSALTPRWEKVSEELYPQIEAQPVDESSKCRRQIKHTFIKDLNHIVVPRFNKKMRAPYGSSIAAHSKYTRWSGKQIPSFTTQSTIS